MSKPKQHPAFYIERYLASGDVPGKAANDVASAPNGASDSAAEGTAPPRDCLSELPLGVVEADDAEHKDKEHAPEAKAKPESAVKPPQKGAESKASSKASSTASSKAGRKADPDDVDDLAEREKQRQAHNRQCLDTERFRPQKL